MKTLKSISFALFMPLLLSYCFSVNVVKSEVKRGPAIESSAKTLKQNVKAFLKAV